MFDIGAVGMYAHVTLTRHRLSDMFENTGCIMDRINRDAYSYHQIYFRTDGRVIHNVLLGEIGDLGGQETRSLRPIYLFGNVWSK